MPSPKRGPRLGGGPAHQKLMLAGMASDLFRHGRIKTTHTKAKTLRPYAEKLITKAKQGDLHARRQVLSKLRDRDVVAYLFEDVAPRFADRNGGYTRILKLGPRPGDNAPMALIELVDMGDRSGDEAIEVEKSRRSRGLFGRRRKRQDTDVSVGGQGAAAATIADALEETPEDIADETDAPADTDEGVEAQAPADTEVSAPDDETVGDPPNMEGDEPDAGGATGKDAGRS